MAQFDKILKLLRSEKNMSQQELADALGISKSSINMYERGDRQPNLDMLEKIAEYFNVTVDYLLGITQKDIDEACDYALGVIAKATPRKKTQTIAAHFDGDEFTEEELDEIRKFAEFVKAKRK